jgi:hypothetical protein
LATPVSASVAASCASSRSRAGASAARGEQPGQPQQPGTQHAGGTTDQQRRAPPSAEHLITGERDHHRQRQVADPRIGVKPLLVVHARSAGETAAAILVAENPYHVGSVAEALADGVVLQMRLLRQQHAVAVDDVQGAVFADVEAVEQLIEVVEFHRRHRHSGEFAGFEEIRRLKLMRH